MSSSTSTCCKTGPGYASPLEAMQNGPREKLLYVAMIPCEEGQPDYLATIDVDPNSSNYQKVINRLYIPEKDNELHHFGWNACSSCHGDSNRQRRFIVLGGFKSSRIYIVDTENETKPSIHKTIDADELKKLDLSAPHTVHCLGSGEIMVSCLGNAKGELPGGYALLNQNFEVLSRWNKEDNPKEVQFYYDFWYKPRSNIMVSSEWAAPNVFQKGKNIFFFYL
jgi:selenium-binding protein 1